MVTECWIQEDSVNFFNLNGYNAIFQCRSENKGCGVVIYVHNSHSFVKVTGMSCIHDVLIIDVLIGKKNYYFVAVYNPKINQLKEFLLDLELCLSRLRLQTTFILGDFNVGPSRDQSSYSLIEDLMGSYNFFLCNKSLPTRSMGNSSALLDHIYMNNLDLKHLTYNIDKIFSDHNLLLIRLYIDNMETDSPLFKCTRLDYTKLDHYFENKQFVTISECPRLFYDELKECVKGGLEASSITKCIRKKDNDCFTAPWIDDYYLLCKRRNILFHKLKRNPQNQFLKEDYKSCNNLVISYKRRKKI